MDRGMVIFLGRCSRSRRAGWGWCCSRSGSSATSSRTRRTRPTTRTRSRSRGGARGQEGVPAQRVHVLPHPAGAEREVRQLVGRERRDEDRRGHQARLGPAPHRVARLHLRQPHDARHHAHRAGPRQHRRADTPRRGTTRTCSTRGASTTWSIMPSFAFLYTQGEGRRRASREGAVNSAASGPSIPATAGGRARSEWDAILARARRRDPAQVPRRTSRRRRIDLEHGRGQEAAARLLADDAEEEGTRSSRPPTARRWSRICWHSARPRCRCRRRRNEHRPTDAPIDTDAPATGPEPTPSRTCTARTWRR